MDVRSLIDEKIDPELIEWLTKKETAVNALNAIEELFVGLKQTLNLGIVDEFVSITGPVHIGAGSHIHPHVTIEGPVIIGENVSVRSGAQIRNHAYIGSDCVIGHGADIKRSLCLNGAKMQDGTFVGDSVIGAGARVGSGAILANRKFNQSEVSIKTQDGILLPTGRKFLGALMGRFSRLGANVVLSPGTVIGEYTWVASGLVVSGTHGPDLLITAKQELDIRPKSRVDLSSGREDYEHI